MDTLHITTRAQAEAAGQVILKVHGVNNGLDPHLRPEHQPRAAINTTPMQAPPKSNVQSIARKIISRSIEHLGKSATGNTTTTLCTDTAPPTDFNPRNFSTTPLFPPDVPFKPFLPVSDHNS